MKAPTILITGSTGFVGRALVRQFSALQVSLLAAVRTDSHLLEAEQDNAAKYVVVGDIFDLEHENLMEIMSSVDTVIHAAWYTSRADYLNSGGNLKAMNGSIKLAQAAAAAGVRRFIGIGTAFEYGYQKSPIHSDSGLEPTNLYASSKVATYYLQRQILGSAEVDFAWVRLFNLYGEGESPDRLFPYIRNQLSEGKKALLGAPNRVRDYLDIDVAASQIARISLGDYVGCLNVCSGVGVSIRQVGESIAEEYGRPDLLEFGVAVREGFEPLESVGVPSLGEYISPFSRADSEESP